MAGLGPLGSELGACLHHEMPCLPGPEPSRRSHMVPGCASGRTQVLELCRSWLCYHIMDEEVTRKLPGERLQLSGHMARAGHLGEADTCGQWPLEPLPVGGIHLWGATEELLRKSEPSGRGA